MAIRHHPDIVGMSATSRAASIGQQTHRRGLVDQRVRLPLGDVLGVDVARLERVEVERDPRVDRRLHDAAGVLEPVDPGLRRLAGVASPARWPVTLSPSMWASSTIGRSSSTGIISRTLIAIAPAPRAADDPSRHLVVLDPDEVVASRRRYVEAVAGVEDAWSVRAPGLDLVAGRRDPLDVVADVLHGRDAVGEEQLAHPLEVVDVDVDQAGQHVPAGDVDTLGVAGTGTVDAGTDRDRSGRRR